ncbi:VWA domain-containing protein [Candidatus Woesearchaeota archaeon]|nr:VWA domain-containing protein [Candidatus Woesearchaeota archaeon]
MVELAAFEHPKLLLLIPAAVALLFLIIRKDFVKLRGERWKLLEKAKIRKRLVVFALRSIVAASLIIALAQPVTVKQQMSTGEPSLTILLDDSKSFGLYDRQTVQAIKEKLQNDIPVTIRHIGLENSSPLGDELLANMLGNDNLLLVSDGRVTKGRSLGDVMVVASSINSTINALYLNPVKSDLAVRVEGPRVSTVGVDNEFLARVDQTSPPGTEPIPYRMTIKLDGDVITEQGSAGTDTFKFKRKLAEGYHKIEAEITANDNFQENNVFYKTAKVEKKPKVLLITEGSSPLEGIFMPVYDLSTVQTVQGNSIAGYSAVVFNDVPASQVDMDQLGKFIDDGNGLVVFGGRNSYDKGSYKDTVFESLLPVKVGVGEEGAKKFVNVVLLIDISGSTGSGFGTGSSSTVEEVEKALAIGVLNDLRLEDRAGIIAFNVEPHTVAGLERVSGSKKELISKVQRLIYTGSTLIGEGLRGASKMLAPEDGSKNIVLFSDGKSGSMGEDLQTARIAAANGIKVYTVGVGEDTNREHMQAIAKAGNGAYFEPSEAQKLKIIFGSGEAASTDKMKLEKLNNNHFITGNVKLNARLSGFNQVVPKPNADVLVATAENRAILTVWRFGLGRIASVATDDGLGWAPELFNSENSVLITRTVNWAIGDLSRNKRFDVTAKDTFIGDEFKVDVLADSMPADRRMAFSKVGERLYSSQLKAEKPGWYAFFDATAAANYPLELLSTGYDPDLGVLVQLTGGKVFTPDQTAELLRKVREDSKRVVTTHKSLAWIPLAIALLFFLLDIAARKMMEETDSK